METMVNLTKTMSPDEAMTILKKKVQTVTEDELKGFYSAGMTLLKNIRLLDRLRQRRNFSFTSLVVREKSN